MNTCMMSVVTTMMSILLAMMFSSMQEKTSDKKEEKMSFECGFSNMNPIKMSFSTNFIMIIIMFLVFDVEVSIMIPMTMEDKVTEKEVVAVSVFLMALTLIMIKEWNQGAIDWTQ